MKSLTCRCGKGILLDDDKYEELKDVQWRCSKSAVFQQGTRNSLSMPHFIKPIPDGLLPDHINRDFHDNRKENIRFATRAENMSNSKIRSDNMTGYRGVSWSEPAKSYEYRLTKDGITYRQRGFSTPEEAALAYNIKAKEIYKEYAFQNKI